MTQAQYAAIVNRQRQIALAKQRQQLDLSDNNITNEEIADTKQKLQQEMATKKQKKATPQMTTPLPKEIPSPVPAKKESTPPLRQEVPVLSKNGFKQNTVKNNDEKEQINSNTFQEFINKTKNTNYDDIIKEKNNLIETYKTERDNIEKKIETLTTRYELKLKKNDETVATLNETIKNLTEMLNIKFKKENEDTKSVKTTDVKTTDVETKHVETKHVETNDAETNTDIDVKLHVEGEEIKVEIKAVEGDISNN